MNAPYPDETANSGPATVSAKAAPAEIPVDAAPAATTPSAPFEDGDEYEPV